MVDADAQALIARVNKTLGEGTFVLASDLQVPRRYTTGSLGLDVILGGGLPGNQWVEVVGKASAGKTAMIFKTIAANQREDDNFTTLWVAGEHFDSDQATALGVDVSRVILVPYGQEMEVAFQVMLEAAESKAVDCIVLDSYPALLPDEEDEKAMDEATVAMGARLFGKFVRKAGKATRRKYDGSERPMIGIIVNQYRDKIGGFSRFGTPQTTPGGNAKDYFFYTRIDVARTDFIEENRPGLGKVVVGQKIKFKTIKNKAAAPQQTHEIRFFNRGAPFLGFKRGDYDLVDEYFNVAKDFGVLRFAGGYTLGDQKYKSGDALIEALRSEPALMRQLREQVLEVAKNPHIIDELKEEAA